MSSEVYKELFNVATGTSLSTSYFSPTPATGNAWIISRLNIANPGTSGQFWIQSNSYMYLTGGGAAGESLADNSHDKWTGLVLNSGDRLYFASNNGMEIVAYGSEVTY